MPALDLQQSNLHDGSFTVHESPRGRSTAGRARTLDGVCERYQPMTPVAQLRR